MNDKRYYPAFPFVVDFGGHDKQSDDGINQLQFFAAFAPEIPTWFEISDDDAPKKPKAWDEYENKVGNQEMWLLKKWHHGDLFDSGVPKNLQWYVKEWNEYREAEKQYRKAHLAARFFQWRWHYAQMMCSTMPTPQVVAESQGKIDFTTSSLTQQKSYGKE